MDRMIRLKPNETAKSLAALGNGEPSDLGRVNKFLTSDGSAYVPWNPGQQMIVPPTWAAMPDEYPSK